MKYNALCIILMMLSASCSRSGTSSQTQEKESSEEHNDKVAVSVDLWTADSIAYRRWGSPASPYRDEERYITFLNSLLATDSVPEELRARAEYRKRIAMLNRPGTIAADFRYLERGGKKSRLHNVDSPLTLLVFYDPECPHCGDILRYIASSETINRAIAEEKITVVAIYAEGKRDVWDKTRDDLPDNWLVGYDLTGVLENELYDLPAMPTPFLLDSVKRVILKDPNPTHLIACIERLRCKDF